MNHLIRKTNSDILEIVDLKTGDILKLQSVKHDLPDSMFTEQTLDGKLVKVQRGLDLSTYRQAPMMAFSNIILDEICEMIASGKTIIEICAMPNMPNYIQLCYWRRNVEGVRQMLKEAEADRADYHAHKALLEAEGSDEKGADKLRVSTHQWLAQVSDPEKYSPKTKISGDEAHPVRILFDTGIRRPEDYPKDEASFSERQAHQIEGDSGTPEASIQDPKPTTDTSDSGNGTETNE